MIKVEKIAIEEFRGIRNLTIEFKNNNFAVCGRNGTGKSGIVDALEFALTGNISRLSGAGTGGISLKEHAPHVDSRNDPEKAKVILTVSIPSLSKTVTIERSVKDISSPIITPNTKDVLDVLDQVATHPEFVLSRRELIKYVISAPGDRAREVQALLRLDKVDEMRVVLQKISNSCRKEVPLLLREKDEAQRSLTTALVITEFNQAKLLEAVNIQRAILGLSEITTLTPKTSIKDGLIVAKAASHTLNISKPQALADIKKLRESIDDLSASTTQTAITEITERISDLNKNPEFTSGMNKQQLLKLALQATDKDSCPVCDLPWEHAKLEEHLQAKLKDLDDLNKKREDLEKELSPFVSKVDILNSQLGIIESYGALIKPPLDLKSIKDFRVELRNKKSNLYNFFPIEDTLLSLSNYCAIPKDVLALVDLIEATVTAIPDPTKQDAARDYLTIGQEKLEAYRAISLRHKQAEERAKMTATIFDTFATVSTDFLNNIYKDVEKDFSELYSFINQDDESGFTAQLKPSIGKLGFDVDFYGRGFFPPGAYHSEGHQDGMGLCLYLALMKHLLKDSFTFAVLDDVLMSVDKGHRREVCKLLKEKFLTTQFILTTHDEVWLKHMKSAGLIDSKSSMFFRKWDVDAGPSEWSNRDIWAEIEDELKLDRVPSASLLLRNYLEYISTEMCHKLRAKVEFRGDGQFQLGDLLPSATSQFSKLLKEGETSAISWGKTAEADEIKKKREAFDLLVAASNVEQWQTNAAIHYNEWANLEAKDFRPVVKSYKDLVEAFHCSNVACGSLYYISSERGPKDEVRCFCGDLTANLKKK